MLSASAAFFLAPAAGFAADALADVERRFGVRLGVFAEDLRTHRIIAYRAGERFPLASTVKVPVVMAILDRVDRATFSLRQTIRFRKSDLVPPYSRIARDYPNGGSLPLETVCALTISESDNTGVDLLFRELGGPQVVNAYVAKIGFPQTRIDRLERDLPHEASLSDPRDTATPRAMALLLRRLQTHSPLSAHATALLLAWMRATTTGDQRLRAGVPHGWHVADKTGTYANAVNDIGLLYPPGDAPPIVIAVYTFGKDSGSASPAIAQIASRAVRI